MTMWREIQIQICPDLSAAPYIMLSLQLDALCDYTKATTSSRNMIEGQKLVNCNMIILCGAVAKTTEKMNLYSLCLQTSALTSKPHTITGTLLIHAANSDDKLVTIEKMDCSCKAGSGHSCKHIVAVLLYCNRMDLNLLQLISSTDKKCYWKQCKNPVLEEFEPQPTKTFCCVNRTQLPSLPNNVLESIRNELIGCDGESAIAKHRYRKRTLSGVRAPLKSIENVISSNESWIQKANEAAIKEIFSNARNQKLWTTINEHVVNIDTCCRDTYNKLIVCNEIYIYIYIPIYMYI